MTSPSGTGPRSGDRPGHFDLVGDHPRLLRADFGAQRSDGYLRQKARRAQPSGWRFGALKQDRPEETLVRSITGSIAGRNGSDRKI